MARTAQQQTVVDTVKDPNTSLIKVKAIAGAGKTFTLVEVAEEIQPKSGLYLAYNKAIAAEAEEKFVKTNMKCSTIHALAYRAVVKQYGLRVGYFGIRDVKPAKTPYRTKAAVVNALEDFFLSAYTDPAEFLDDKDINGTTHKLFLEHLDQMSDGQIACSHSFYLKLYHVYMAAGEIPVPEVEMLMMDEAGDITELTLDIFRMIKAKKKIAVGDPMQNIYSFNKTINAFTTLEGEGVSANLSESFRVSDKIAAKIQRFVRGTMDASFVFKGRTYPKDEPVTSRAYISRGNSELVSMMFDLMKEGQHFNLTRPIDTILELPLILANLGNGRAITEYRYKDIEKLRKEWTGDKSLQMTYKTVNEYVRRSFSTDTEVQRAFQVVYAHGPVDLNNLAKYARECAKANHAITLTTAHSSKGLEFSSVTILEDLNDKVMEAIQAIAVESHKRRPNDDVLNKLHEELRLYYVACSRAMIELKNAKYL